MNSEQYFLKNANEERRYIFVRIVIKDFVLLLRKLGVIQMTDRERLIGLIDEFGDDIAFCDIYDNPSLKAFLGLNIKKLFD